MGVEFDGPSEGHPSACHVPMWRFVHRSEDHLSIHIGDFGRMVQSKQADEFAAHAEAGFGSQSDRPEVSL